MLINTQVIIDTQGENNVDIIKEIGVPGDFDFVVMGHHNNAVTPTVWESDSEK